MPNQNPHADLSGVPWIMPVLLQTAIRERPFARRALITLLPPLDFMRTRKPWVRFLLVTDGWYVRFIVMLSIINL